MTYLDERIFIIVEEMYDYVYDRITWEWRVESRIGSRFRIVMKGSEDTIAEANIRSQRAAEYYEVYPKLEVRSRFEREHVLHNMS